MSQPDKGALLFPMLCPTCRQLAGKPIMAGTILKSGAIQVRMRCGECGHEWTFDMPIRTAGAIRLPQPASE